MQYAIVRLSVLLLLFIATEGSAEEITGKVVGIADGDTLTVLVGTTPTKVRLAEIDTPEMGQPFGDRAKQGLSELVFGKPIRVVVTDRDQYGRDVGRVFVNELDVNKELVRRGLAWAYLQYETDASFFHPRGRGTRREARSVGAARSTATTTVELAARG